MLCAFFYYYRHNSTTRALCTKDIMYFLSVIYFYFLSLTRWPRSRVEDVLYGRQRPSRTPAKWHTFYSLLAPEAFDGLIYGRRLRTPAATPPSTSLLRLVASATVRSVGRWVGGRGSPSTNSTAARLPQSAVAAAY